VSALEHRYRFKSHPRHHQVRLVLQDAAPRVVDWYKPINKAASGAAPTFDGSYVRRMEIQGNGVGSLTTTYALADGTTVTGNGARIVLHSAANGSLTTTQQFADGKSYSVTITPLVGQDGYTITRRGQTYTVLFTRDVSTGSITGMDVTLDGATTSYVEAADGTWSKV
jgi:hypothetical protein